jgi:hypothetical protein
MDEDVKAHRCSDVSESYSAMPLHGAASYGFNGLVRVMQYGGCNSVCHDIPQQPKRC